MNITNINNYLPIEQQPNNQELTSIIALPNEIIENILVNLDVAEIVQARRVCTRLLKIIDNNQGVCSLKIKFYKYNKLYSQSSRQIDNIIINNYQQRFDPWLQSLSIAVSELRYCKYIIDNSKIHGQYYCLAKLLSSDNQYKFTEIKQITIDACFQNKVPYKQRLFHNFYMTNDQDIFLITTTDQSYLLVSMQGDTVATSYGIANNDIHSIETFISSPIQKFLHINDFIVYLNVINTYNNIYILKKINGSYTNVLVVNATFKESMRIFYLGKRQGNINFLIRKGNSVLIYEENKQVEYNENKLKNSYWNITKIFKTEDNLHLFSPDATIVTSENGLIFIKENLLHDLSNMIHVYRYNEKITIISLTDKEKQDGCLFSEIFACNNSGTSFTVGKIDPNYQSYFSVYKIVHNTIEHSYTIKSDYEIDHSTIIKKDSNFIKYIQYSPCGNFIEVTHKKNVTFIKSIYSIQHKDNCVEFPHTIGVPHAFNNTGFLHALAINKKMPISCYTNQKVKEVTTINCMHKILKVIFSPNSQLVAIMGKNNANEVVIKVYRIFKLQQDGTVEFSPIKKELPTEVFAEINTEDIIDFKFHPDGFKIIVITIKAIKIFSLTAKQNSKK